MLTSNFQTKRFVTLAYCVENLISNLFDDSRTSVGMITDACGVHEIWKINALAIARTI